MSKNITSYDLLKTLAVLTMVIDHIGLYFFPDELWFRAIGRMSAPIWFFLVGYARSRDMSPTLLAGAGLLLVSNFMAGMAIFPLNVLATIIAIRLVIDRLMQFMLADNRRHFWRMAVLMAMLAIPTMMIIEYGTLALIIAMLGYLVRQQDGKDQFLYLYTTFAILAYGGLQVMSFTFDSPQIAFTMAGSFMLMMGLSFFRAQEYPALTAKMPRPVTWFLQFGGRRTLEIYVAHLLIFKALAVYWGLNGYGFFDWRWIEL